MVERNASAGEQDVVPDEFCVILATCAEQAVPEERDRAAVTGRIQVPGH